jgi:hypothetical protein
VSDRINQQIRDSANGEACVVCGARDGTIVWAHSNECRHGKGKGIKSLDAFGFFACHRCHAFYDSGGMARDEARRWFAEQWRKSMDRLKEKIETGELRV